MPGFDGTGPGGYGPMTGGGRGYCAPGYGGAFRRGFGGGYGGGYGYGRGRGFGRGWAGAGRGVGFAGRAPVYGAADPGYQWGYGPANQGSELEMLRSEADSLSGALDDINRRMQELEKNPEE
jgi:hypothetical protein